MKKHLIEIELAVFEAISELPLPIQNLMHKAQEAREKAYAPYSRFRVGAAVLLDDGTVVLGNNQENAAFPSGLCAERVAIYHAGAQFPHSTINAIAVTARSQKQEITTPIPPCGACRQAIAEYELNQSQPIAIYFMGETGKIARAASIKDLLPLIFDSSYLT